MYSGSGIQLNAPAGTLPSLMAAVDAGADSVYIGFASPTNLRNLPGLNFSVEEAVEGVKYAHQRGAKVHVAVNTLPRNHELQECFGAIDDAGDIGADVVIAADLAVLEYARTKHPHLELHLSCMAGAADIAAVRFYIEEFGVRCVILPRMLSLRQIAAIRGETDVLLEVMVFGVLCPNYEGRCYLSSFITGMSANSMGACAPAELLEFEETEGGRLSLRLNGVLINEFLAGEPCTYPTPCKGRYYSPTIGRLLPAFQESCCLNALPLLPELVSIGVNALKIEGRQRSAGYARLVTRVWRAAIDALRGSDDMDLQGNWERDLKSVMEGQACTVGALDGV